MHIAFAPRADNKREGGSLSRMALARESLKGLGLGRDPRQRRRLPVPRRCDCRSAMSVLSDMEDLDTVAHAWMGNPGSAT